MHHASFKFAAFASTIMLIAGTASAQWTVIDLHPTSGWDVSTATSVGTPFEQAGWVANNPFFTPYACWWTGTAETWRNLHPAGAGQSMAVDAEDGYQVGWVDTNFVEASLWAGTAESWVSLHPAGSNHSTATCMTRGVQGGFAYFGGDLPEAGLWFGTASSWISLHPPGTLGSSITSMHGNQQAGFTHVGDGNTLNAALWNGSAASWQSLHPVGALGSIVNATDGTQQVGVVAGDGTAAASLWTGTAASWVNLHPVDAEVSEAYGVASGIQAGWSAFADGFPRACVWAGTSESYEDLHQYVPSQFVASYATGAHTDGGMIFVSGYAADEFGGTHAVVWTKPLPTSCYADCDVNGTLSIDDFICFQTFFAIGDPAADCDASGQLNIDDFICFQTFFALGC